MDNSVWAATASFLGSIFGGSATSALIIFFGNGHRERKNWWREKRYTFYVELLTKAEEATNEVDYASDHYLEQAPPQFDEAEPPAHQLILMDKKVEAAYRAWHRALWIASTRLHTSYAHRESPTKEFDHDKARTDCMSATITAVARLGDLSEAIQKNLGLNKLRMRSDD
ncbi:hypothetical protein [Sinomonas susongensis]|uniref:hypothetical protein n=1 Tax=Sinomonas susongensis TaxID=1324851 RepID=UPI0011080F79|nr:hypothetical protein [Sinomonas susongensis]